MTTQTYGEVNKEARDIASAASQASHAKYGTYAWAAGAFEAFACQIIAEGTPAQREDWMRRLRGLAELAGAKL
jgi:hypothetical protein